MVSTSGRLSTSATVKSRTSRLFLVLGTAISETESCPREKPVLSSLKATESTIFRHPTSVYLDTNGRYRTSTNGDTSIHSAISSEPNFKTFHAFNRFPARSTAVRRCYEYRARVRLPPMYDTAAVHEKPYLEDHDTCCTVYTTLSTHRPETTPQRLIGLDTRLIKI